MALVLSMPFVWNGSELLRLAAAGPGAGELRTGLVLLAVASDSSRNALILIGLIILVVCGWVIIHALGILGRRRWAREGGMITFGLFSLLAVPVSVSGLLADPPASNAWLGVLTGLTNLAIVALLLATPTARDFEKSEAARMRRRARNASAKIR